MALAASPELLAVLPDFAGGGAERVALALLGGLATRGRGVALVVFEHKGPLAAQLDPAVPVQVLGRARLRSAALPLLRCIRRVRPRTVYSTLGYVNLALAAMRPLLPSQTGLWLREANLPSLSLARGRLPRFVRAAYRGLYPLANRVICTSQRMRDEFATEFGFPSHLLQCLPNPVDEDGIRRLATPSHRAAPCGRKFVAAGRLTAQKGFDRLIDMFAALGDPEARLAILGTGPAESELRQRAHRAGLAGRIQFAGFVATPWAQVASSDAFLLPSRWEGMPNAALEALACGVPVIATPESGGIAELATQAEPGAVTIAEAGAEFVAAMRCVVRHDVVELRPSLLPDIYRLEAVLDRVEGWLDDVA